MTRTRNIAAHGGGGRRIDGHRRQLVGFVGGEATERTQRDGEEDEEGKEAQEDASFLSLPGWPTPMIPAEIDIFFGRDDLKSKSLLKWHHQPATTTTRRPAQ